MTSQTPPARFGGDRSCSKAIYFLLSDSDISVLHHSKAGEVWHFYAGSALNVHESQGYVVQNARCTFYS
nr:cupin domain-containing protein [uncultured Comamonas sp.]